MWHEICNEFSPNAEIKEDRIVCLVGESGSGKSTIAEELGKDYNYIESYTTRKPRYEGETGHIFSNSSMLNAQDVCNNIIAYTHFDNEHYWAIKQQYRGKGTSIYVIDPKGIMQLKQTVHDAEIIVIYLKSEEKIRQYRMQQRYRKTHDVDNQIFTEQQKINSDAWYGAKNRIEHDREAFKLIECNWVVDANRSLDEVLNDVKTIIERS